MKSELPDADEVFLAYFARWYSPEDMIRRQFAATRPDAEGWAPAGTPVGDASPLSAGGQQAVAEQVERMFVAATHDWPGQFALSGAASLEWIESFDRKYDRPRISQLIAQSNPADFSNDLLILSCEFGAVLGHVLKDMTPQLEWLFDWPYWESALYDAKHGMRINVFHWAIKKFSDYGVDDGFGQKVLQCRDLIRHGWSDSPVA